MHTDGLSPQEPGYEDFRSLDLRGLYDLEMGAGGEPVSRGTSVDAVTSPARHLRACSPRRPRLRPHVGPAPLLVPARSRAWRLTSDTAPGGASSETVVDVLVVDDEDAVRSSICEILGTAGLTTGEASDGEIALEKLALMRVGAMVVDVRMPRLDGLAMLQRLTDPPPTVLVSAYAISDDVRERLSGKVHTYLQKPFPPDDLLKAIAAALQRPQG